MSAAHDSSRFPPPRPTVAFHCYGWKKKDVFKRIHLELDKLCHAEVGKEPTPSALIVDSQTVATSSAGGQAAYDGNKKKKGRKRNVLADTLGLVWHISVNPANIPDLQGAIAVFNEAKSDENFKNVGIVMADASYRGEAVKAAATKNGPEVNIVTGEKGKFVTGRTDASAHMVQRNFLRRCLFDVQVRQPRNHTGASRKKATNQLHRMLGRNTSG